MATLTDIDLHSLNTEQLEEFSGELERLTNNVDDLRSKRYDKAMSVPTSMSESEMIQELSREQKVTQRKMLDKKIKDLNDALDYKIIPGEGLYCIWSRTLDDLIRKELYRLENT